MAHECAVTALPAPAGVAPREPTKDGICAEPVRCEEAQSRGAFHFGVGWHAKNIPRTRSGVSRRSPPITGVSWSAKSRKEIAYCASAGATGMAATLLATILYWSAKIHRIDIVLPGENS